MQARDHVSSQLYLLIAGWPQVTFLSASSRACVLTESARVAAPGIQHALSAAGSLQEELQLRPPRNQTGPKEVPLVIFFFFFFQNL